MTHIFPYITLFQFGAVGSCNTVCVCSVAYGTKQKLIKFSKYYKNPALHSIDKKYELFVSDKKQQAFEVSISECERMDSIWGSFFNFKVNIVFDNDKTTHYLCIYMELSFRSFLPLFSSLLCHTRGSTLLDWQDSDKRKKQLLTWVVQKLSF